MRLRRAAPAALLAVALLAVTPGCTSDSCACQYPDDDPTPSRTARG